MTEERLDSILSKMNCNIFTKKPWRFDLIEIPHGIGWLLSIKYAYGEQETQSRQYFISPAMEDYDVQDSCLRLFEEIVLSEVRTSFYNDYLDRIFPKHD